MPISLIASSLLVELEFQRFTGVSTRACFYVAVMLAAWIGGIWGGLVASLTTVAVVDYFLLPPLYVFDFWKFPASFDVGTFLVALLIITLATASLNHWRDEAVRAQRALAFELDGRSQRWNSAAHDLKHPLAALGLRVELMKRKLTSPEDQADLEDLTETVGEMQSLVTEMQDAAQLASGRGLYLELTNGDLVSIVKSVVDKMAASTGRPIESCFVDAHVEGEWDIPRLERVITNLLSNATKYSPPDSAIEVEVRRDGDEWAEVRIVDHGIGIPAAELEHIFGRFYRASNARQRTAGSGLGLAGSRAIAELHGGELTVQSREGIGSTFTLRLPTRAAESREEVAPRPLSAVLSPDE